MQTLRRGSLTRAGTELAMQEGVTARCRALSATLPCSRAVPLRRCAAGWAGNWAGWCFWMRRSSSLRRRRRLRSHSEPPRVAAAAAAVAGAGVRLQVASCCRVAKL